MSRRLIAVTVVALAILASGLIAGCGGGGPREPTSEEQAAIEQRLQDYAQAFAAGDEKAICGSFTPDGVEALGGEAACEKAYGALAGSDAEVLAGALQDLEIDHIDVADDGSITRLYAPDAINPVRFQPVDGDWYVVPPPALPDSEAAVEDSGN
jgi:predicted small lipoprotein YifL